MMKYDKDQRKIIWAWVGVCLFILAFWVLVGIACWNMFEQVMGT